MKEWQKLPAGTGSDTAAHWFQFPEGADEAFHSELWPFLLLMGHVVLPYSLQYLLREKCLPSACPDLAEHRSAWQWMANASERWNSKIFCLQFSLKIPHIKQILSILVWIKFVE